MRNKQSSAQLVTLRRVLQYLKRDRKWIVSTLILAAVTVALTLYIPIMIGNALDCIESAGNVDFSTVTQILIIIGSSAALTAVLQWSMSILNNRITYEAVARIRNQAFRKLARLPLSYLDTQPAGDIVSRMISDVDQFADGLLLGFTQLFTGILTILGTLIFMLTIHLGITLTVILLTPLSLFVASFIAKHTYAMFSKQAALRAGQTAMINETVAGQKVVQAFGHEAKIMEQFDDSNDRLSDAALKATFFSSLTNPCTRFVNALVYAAVALTGSLAAIRGTITVGGLSCFLSYANQYTKPFNEISGVITELQNAIACADRIFALIDLPEETENSDDAISLFHAEGNVRFSHVSFSYVPERPLITDCNLNVKPGQHIAIVGPTGSGKTTLINLLMRFYDVNDGDICLDDTSIYSLQRKALRSNYGMVLQETFLKSGTVFENVAYGKENATLEEVMEACRKVKAHSFIMRLPEGYDTQITENGSELSQGERQLLCIARVMVNLPNILILDEATSSIDTRTEMMIQNASNAMMQDRTTFIVAHRLSTIREADMIMVMKNGRIAEMGDHESLLRKRGFYYLLYNSQFEN